MGPTHIECTPVSPPFQYLSFYQDSFNSVVIHTVRQENVIWSCGWSSLQSIVVPALLPWLPGACSVLDQYSGIVLSLIFMIPRESVLDFRDKFFNLLSLILPCFNLKISQKLRLQRNYVLFPFRLGQRIVGSKVDFWNYYTKINQTSDIMRCDFLPLWFQIISFILEGTKW